MNTCAEKFEKYKDNPEIKALRGLLGLLRIKISTVDFVFTAGFATKVHFSSYAATGSPEDIINGTVFTEYTPPNSGGTQGKNLIIFQWFSGKETGTYTGSVAYSPGGKIGTPNLFATSAS